MLKKLIYCYHVCMYFGKGKMLATTCILCPLTFTFFGSYETQIVLSESFRCRRHCLRRKRKRKTSSCRKWRYECIESKAGIPIGKILWHKKRLYCTGGDLDLGFWHNFRVHSSGSLEQENSSSKSSLLNISYGHVVRDFESEAKTR